MPSGIGQLTDPFIRSLIFVISDVTVAEAVYMHQCRLCLFVCLLACLFVSKEQEWL